MPKRVRKEAKEASLVIQQANGEPAVIQQQEESKGKKRMSASERKKAKRNKKGEEMKPNTHASTMVRIPLFSFTLLIYFHLVLLFSITPFSKINIAE